MAKRQWTLEQRKQQAEKIRQWQPWKLSTGAQTIEGKAIASRNSFKGGVAQQLKALRQLLRQHGQQIDELL